VIDVDIIAIAAVRRVFRLRILLCISLGTPEELGVQYELQFDEVDPDRFAAWREFHHANPHVFELFERFANEARKSGRKRFGARMIGERIRWYSQIETSGSDFKINDHCWPYYARLLMAIDDSFRGFFMTKEVSFDANDKMILGAHFGNAGR